MSARLTRSHRREIENKTHQKIDLDHLSEFNVKQLVLEEAPQSEELTLVEESNREEEEASCSDDNETSEEEESDNEESEEEESDDNEDLDALLNKAQEALKIHSIELEKKEKPISTKLSQMQSGISFDKELYFKTNSGRSKLVTEAVELLSPGEKKKASNKSAVVLQESKDEDAKKMNKKERQLAREKTTGSAWFDMPKAEMTDEIKRDLQILKMRHILDRKRHYKKMGSRPDPKYFQIGTIIESPTEFFSARMNKKDRKQTIVEELMANDDQKQYYKRKFNEVQDRTNSGGKRDWKKLKAQRKWAK